MTEIVEGMLVRHPKKPEWGLGKVLAVKGSDVTVHFSNDTENHRRIRLGPVKLSIAEGESNHLLNHLPPFEEGEFVRKSDRVTLEQGIAFFKEQFPGGFSDPRYKEVPKGETGGERNYKDRAHQRYVAAFGESRGAAMLQAGDIKQLCQMR